MLFQAGRKRSQRNNAGRKEVCKRWGNKFLSEVIATARYTMFSILPKLQSELNMHSNLE